MESNPLLPNEKLIIPSRKWILTVEPVIFLMSLTYGTSSVTVQSFYIQRICEYNLERNHSTIYDMCANLTQHSDEETTVEISAASYSSYQYAIESAPPIILAIFWGQLNDLLGSKNLMFVPLGGFTLASTTLYILSYYPGSTPMLLLLASVLIGLSGGSVALTISIIKLIVHNSSESDRTFRVGVAETALVTGSSIGLILGSALLNLCSYGAVFFFNGAAQITAIACALIFLENDKPDGIGSTTMASGLFNVTGNLKSILAWCKAEQHHKHRNTMLLIVLIVSIRSLMIAGDTQIAFLYTRRRFKWGPAEFSAFKTYDGLMASMGILLTSTIALNYLRIQDSLVGIAASLSYFIGSCVSAFASKSWMMYLAGGILFCSGAARIVVTSMVSKIVGSKDVGKALSFVSIPENMVPFIAVPIYDQLYAASLQSFAGATYLLSAFLSFSVVLAFGFLFLKLQDT